jgi:hypothetical protein
MLRFLAQNHKEALAKTVIAYLVRGISISRTGNISHKGTVKISWIAQTFDLSERAASYARAELVRLGWIGRDTGSFQRKLNRDGAYFVINLDWRFTQKSAPETSVATLPVDNPAQSLVNSDKQVLDFAPLPPEICTDFAPPYKDKKTSKEDKNQKTQNSEPLRSGFYLNQVGEVVVASPQLPDPVLSNIRQEDFYHLSRLEALYAQAIAWGWINSSEAAALNFISAAVRAREVGNDPARVFVTLVRRKLWHHITQAQEDKARTALNRIRSDDPDRFRLPIPKRPASPMAA